MWSSTQTANTFTLSEDMTYITGDITLASGTTLTMGGYDMTLAGGKKVTNNGTWTAPTSGKCFYMLRGMALLREIMP